MTVGRFTVLKIVVLMIILCIPELGSLCYGCGNPETFRFKNSDVFDSKLFLLIIHIKDLRPVLVADIRSLAASARELGADLVTRAALTGESMLVKGVAGA